MGGIVHLTPFDQSTASSALSVADEIASISLYFDALSSRPLLVRGIFSNRADHLLQPLDGSIVG